MVRNLINIKNIAIVAVFSLVAFFGFNSFINQNSETVKSNVIETVWHFTGTTPEEIYNPEFWQSEDPEDINCSSSADALPCQFTVTSTPIADPEDLVTYLELNYSEDPEGVATAADSRKPEL